MIAVDDLLLSNIQERYSHKGQKLKISATSGSLHLADDSRLALLQSSTTKILLKTRQLTITIQNEQNINNFLFFK